MPRNLIRRGATWHYRFRRAGRDYQGSLETTDREVAAKRLEFKRQEMAARAWGEGSLRTFDEAVSRFKADHYDALKPASRARYDVSIRALGARFSGRHLREIGSALLTDFETDRKGVGVCSSTIRRDFACFSSIFTHCEAWEWHSSNPVRAYVRGRARNGLTESRPRSRSLSLDEERLVLGHASSVAADAIAFAIDTGLRKEEQFSLRWDDVDLDLNQITVRAEVAKSHRTRTVPLLDRSRAILERMPRHKLSPFVFVSKRGTRYPQGSRHFNKALADAVRRAGIERGVPLERLVWHDLRRTCGSRLLAVRRLDLLEVSKWLGHSSVSITERVYVKHGVDMLHKALQRGRATPTNQTPTPETVSNG